MLVTEPAYREMDGQSARLGSRLRSLLRRMIGRDVETVTADGDCLQRSEHQSHLHVIARTDMSAQPPADVSDITEPEFRWRRHPLLRDRTADANSPAERDLDLRTAKSAAVRGIFFARSRRFGEAEVSFSDAAAHGELDLAAIPGFWDLSRAGMEAAIRAYEANGRYRDASALAARIRMTYRPKAVAPLPPADHNRRSASGG
jgi:hypothetical protein